MILKPSNFYRSVAKRTNLKAFELAAAFCFSYLTFTGAFSQDRPSNVTLTANPVYVANCAKCHGKAAEGRHFRGPSLVSGKVATASADELRNLITNGKGHMPKFGGKLTPEEIDTLVQEIKASKSK
jgi:mono/diheme cytochrome c family protein